jgi:hypothetical protein
VSDHEPTDASDPTGSAAATVSATERRFEVVATILLAVAALATAWSGYQAALWGGIQSSDYSQATVARIEAAQARAEANERRIADLTVFESYIDAFIDGDDRLADFYRVRFGDEFDVAFDAWIALDPLENPDAPASPLAMDEYRLAQDADAAVLEDQATALFASGEDANGFSDRYTMSTLLFAVVLFFAAISERFEYLRMRMVLLGLATVGLIAGLVVALGQPVAA